MPKTIINELLVTGLRPSEKIALANSFDCASCLGFFEASAPVPDEIRIQGEAAIQEWRRANWGTPGPYRLEILDFSADSCFGEKDSPSTLIRRLFSLDTPPVGIITDLSLKYPDAVCTLRTANSDGSGDDAVVYTATNGSLTETRVAPDDIGSYIHALYRRDEDPS